jgi:hypothetical protein
VQHLRHLVGLRRDCAEGRNSKDSIQILRIKV